MPGGASRPIVLLAPPPYAAEACSSANLTVALPLDLAANGLADTRAPTPSPSLWADPRGCKALSYDELVGYGREAARSVASVASVGAGADTGTGVALDSSHGSFLVGRTNASGGLSLVRMRHATMLRWLRTRHPFQTAGAHARIAAEQPQVSLIPGSPLGMCPFSSSDAIAFVWDLLAGQTRTLATLGFARLGGVKRPIGPLPLFHTGAKHPTGSSLCSTGGSHPTAPLSVSQGSGPSTRAFRRP